MFFAATPPETNLSFDVCVWKKYWDSELKWAHFVFFLHTDENKCSHLPCVPHSVRHLWLCLKVHWSRWAMMSHSYSFHTLSVTLSRTAVVKGRDPSVMGCPIKLYRSKTWCIWTEGLVFRSQIVSTQLLHISSFSPLVRVRQSPSHCQDGRERPDPIGRQSGAAVKLQWLCWDSGGLPRHCNDPIRTSTES